MTNGTRLVGVPELTQSVESAYAAVADGPARGVWTAGACPLDADGAIVAPGDVAAQTHQAMRNLTAALAAAGAEPTDIVKTTLYVASPDRADLVRAWNAYRADMTGHDAPSTLLGVAVLGYPGQLVEIEAVAVVGG